MYWMLPWFGHGWQQRATRLLYHPSACWGGEENGKGKGKKLVGCNNGSLTEQQAKRTVTLTTLLRRIYKRNSEIHRATAPCTTRSWATIHFPPSSFPPGTQYDSTWYQIPCSVWPLSVSLSNCVPSWFLV